MSCGVLSPERGQERETERESEVADVTAHKKLLERVLVASCCRLPTCCACVLLFVPLFFFFFFFWVFGERTELHMPRKLSPKYRLSIGKEASCAVCGSSASTTRLWAEGCSCTERNSECISREMEEIPKYRCTRP